jgi:DNA polymerase-3 subunit epsilon
MYAIVDIETTGGSPQIEKITEIAIFIHNGDSIVKEYSTLINPEKKIPYHISSLTGITNAMVAESPKFYEVAKTIVKLTSDCIFVAHNVTFDYQFIRSEFKRLGYNFEREKLCTVQLSRRLIPGLPSYSLGKICNYLNIKIFDRHRAGGDAYATVKLFEYLLNRSKAKSYPLGELNSIDKKNLHPDFQPEKLKTLPQSPGVYYFFDDRRELIYIGKSKDIKSRVLSHFRNYSSKKSIEMLQSIAEVDYETTGSELVALLKESDEIKKHKPVFNRAQRRTYSMYGLYHYTDKQGYICFTLAKNNIKNEVPLRSFSNQRAGKAYVDKIVKQYDLCMKLCGLYPSGGACFAYEIADCRGACIGKEKPEEYNLRANQVVDEHSFQFDSFFILEPGKNSEEQAVIKIECGKYIGYGYLGTGNIGGNLENLDACIHPYKDNRDIQQILRNYLLSHPEIKIVPMTKTCNE